MSLKTFSPLVTIAISVAVAFSLAILLLTTRGAGADGKSPATNRGVAVVELFTSEGCSSCPPADALLSKIITETAKDGRLVFAIAHHVDYWDRLGWRDKFSSAAASARQEAYARSLKLDGIYTPQMIVNGRAEFVGSDAPRARREIDAALATPTTAAVELTVRVTNETTVAVDYTVTGAPPGATLQLFLVERGLTTKVARGENAGRDLPHDNVARGSASVDLTDAAGSATITLAKGVDLTRASIVGLVQATETMAVVGASAVAVQ